MKNISMSDLGLNELDSKDRALYFMWESSHARAERIVVRLWIVVLVLIVALLGTNAGWIYYEHQFEDVIVTQEVEATADGDSDLNLNTVGGDYNVGKSESDTDNQE